MGIFSKIKQGLQKTKEGMVNGIESMLGTFTRIDEDLFEQLEELLITSDVGVYTSSEICENLRERVKKKRITDPSQIKEQLKEIISEMLAGDTTLHLSTKPSIVLVIGVNGVGKTTTIGKLAAGFKKDGKKVVMGAADTFRAAAIEQLSVWADRAGAEIVKHSEGSDPAAVVFDTISAAKSRGYDIAICDTAGRLHNKKNLMDELGKISKVINREAEGCDLEVLLVLDASTGQNAVNQARQFKEVAGITGIILTKLDGTARGGIVISIMNELKIPVKFVGVGEQIDDLQPFSAEDFTNALFS